MTVKSMEKLIYKGSVKDLYEIGEDNLLFHFSDDFSVFDWGKMPDKIEKKGYALSILAAYFFEELGRPAFWQDLVKSPHLKNLNSQYLSQIFATDLARDLQRNGLPSHYLGLFTGGQTKKLADLKNAKSGNTGEPLYLQVQKAQVVRPEERSVGPTSLYFYKQTPRQGLSFIPLEVVFRFGTPAGSSLVSRVKKDPSYAIKLGLDGADKVYDGAIFDRPVIEFFTKLESSDRLLSFQEAANLAYLESYEFNQLYELAQLVALSLYEIFAGCGIKLFDGKIEAAIDRLHLPNESTPARIILADSIGPDELRLDCQGVQLSKEILRVFYRRTDWYKQIEDAKEEAESRPGIKWQDILKQEKKIEAPPLSPDMAEAVSQMYLALAAELSGLDLAELGQHTPLKDVPGKLNKALEA